MGCTSSVAKEDTNFGYMQKETLYYKIKDKKHSDKKPFSVNQANEDIDQMVNESLSSDNSDSDNSIQENQCDDQLDKSEVYEPMKDVLNKHKPARPSKLKEQMQSGIKSENSERRKGKEN